METVRNPIDKPNRVSYHIVLRSQLEEEEVGSKGSLSIIAARGIWRPPSLLPGLSSSLYLSVPIMTRRSNARERNVMVQASKRRRIDG